MQKVFPSIGTNDKIDLTKHDDNQNSNPSSIKRELSLPDFSTKRLKVQISSSVISQSQLPLPTLSAINIPRRDRSLIVENSPDFVVIQ
jgi:hypothetical protein